MIPLLRSVRMVAVTAVMGGLLAKPGISAAGDSVSSEDTTPVAASTPVATSVPIAASVATTDESKPQAVTLKYKYTVGERVEYLVTDESTLEVDFGTGPVTMTYSTQTWKHLDTQAVTDGGRAVLLLTLDRVHMLADGPEGHADFDSNHPGVPPQEFAAIVASVGRPLMELTVDATGRVAGLQEPGHAATQTSTVSTELVERDNSGPVVLPNEPVQVGSRWSEQVQIPVQVDEGRLQQRVALKRNYTLTSIEQGIATIELDSMILTPIQDPTIAAQLIQRTPSGIILFDVEQGRVLSKRTFLNNQVIGHEGAASRLKVVRSYVEQLVNPPASDAEAASVSDAR
ncbi:MAG: hypothetical protein ACK5Q5_04055 [Planctomycetaceae bacterium]